MSKQQCSIVKMYLKIEVISENKMKVTFTAYMKLFFISHHVEHYFPIKVGSSHFFAFLSSQKHYPYLPTLMHVLMPNYQDLKP